MEGKYLLVGQSLARVLKRRGRYVPVDYAARLCEGCGAVYKPKSKRSTYCGRACMRRNRGETWRQNYLARLKAQGRKRRPRGPRKERGPFTCVACGAVYKTRRCKGEGEKYCSHECYFQTRRDHPSKTYQRAAYRGVFFPTCGHCGVMFTSKRKDTGLCSEECSMAQARIKSRAASAEKKKLIERPCKFCNRLFTPEYGNKRRAFCSSRCLKRWGKKQRGSDNHRKRARRAGVEYQYINRTKVFERDGWRCQMCGKATPKYRKGTRYPNAPELDHRTPLALGGPHTYANTQCACRACNAAKGATASIGQLPLIEAWGGGGQGPQQIAAHRAPKAF